MSIDFRLGTPPYEVQLTAPHIPRTALQSKEDARVPRKIQARKSSKDTSREQRSMKQLAKAVNVNAGCLVHVEGQREKVPYTGGLLEMAKEDLGTMELLLRTPDQKHRPIPGTALQSQRLASDQRTSKLVNQARSILRCCA